MTLGELAEWAQEQATINRNLAVYEGTLGNPENVKKHQNADRRITALAAACMELEDARAVIKFFAPEGGPIPTRELKADTDRSLAECGA